MGSDGGTGSGRHSITAGGGDIHGDTPCNEMVGKKLLFVASNHQFWGNREVKVHGTKRLILE